MTRHRKSTNGQINQANLITRLTVEINHMSYTAGCVNSASAIRISICRIIYAVISYIVALVGFQLVAGARYLGSHLLDSPIFGLPGPYEWISILLLDVEDFFNGMEYYRLENFVTIHVNQPSSWPV